MGVNQLPERDPPRPTDLNTSLTVRRLGMVEGSGPGRGIGRRASAWSPGDPSRLQPLPATPWNGLPATRDPSIPVGAGRSGGARGHRRHGCSRAVCNARVASDHRWCVARDSRLGQMANMRRNSVRVRRNTPDIAELSNKGKFGLPFHQLPLEATMLKKLMLSAAVSALMVSGAMAQASPPAADPPKAAAPKADALRLMRRSSSRRRVRISGCFRSSRAPTCSDRTMHRSATSTTSCSTSRARSWVYRRRRGLPRHRREERRHRHERVQGRSRQHRQHRG